MKRIYRKLAGIGLALVLLGTLAAPVAAQGTRDNQVARVAQALQYLQEFLSRTRELVVAGESDKATQLFTRAEETADQAAAKLAEGKLDEAMDLIRQARDLAEQALREARVPATGQGGGQMKERLLREIIQLREQEERCRELLEGLDCPKGQQLLEEGHDAAVLARDLFGRKEYRDALAAVRRAREFLTQCLREIMLCSTNVTDRVGQQVASLEALIAEVEAQALNNPSPEAAAALAAAREALARAEELLAANTDSNIRAALTQLARARELAMHARRLVSAGATPVGSVEILAKRQMDRLLEHLRVGHSLVDDASGQGGRDRLAEADELAGDAQDAIEASEFRNAIVIINQAMRLVNEAIHQARQNLGVSPRPMTGMMQLSAEKALETWQSVEEFVAPLVASSTNQEVASLWAEAQTLAAEAQAAYDDGDYPQTVLKIQAATQLAHRAAAQATQPGNTHPRPGPGGNG